jgi:hypothetical protein
VAGYTESRPAAQELGPAGPSSHLFIVRVWEEEPGRGSEAWRGKVQHVLSGEAYYFRSWEELAGHLRAMLPRSAGEVADRAAAGEAGT